MSPTDLVPPDDRVILRQLEAPTETRFGLVLPEIARERPLRAEVLAVGRGRTWSLDAEPLGEKMWVPLGEHVDLREDYDDEGGYAPDAWTLCGLEVGDEVVIPRYGGSEIEAEDGSIVISILAAEILAVVA